MCTHGHTLTHTVLANLIFQGAYHHHHNETAKEKGITQVEVSYHEEQKNISTAFKGRQKLCVSQYAFPYYSIYY